MKTHKISSFLAGMITMALLIGLCGTAFAAARTEQQTLHFNNIKIKLNGETVTPKNEGGGVVEPFIINGTTYLPVRAVANAMGVDKVEWDAKNNTVVLSDFLPRNLTVAVCAKNLGDCAQKGQLIISNLDFSCMALFSGANTSEVLALAQTLAQDVSKLEQDINDVAQYIDRLKNTDNEFLKDCYSYSFTAQDNNIENQLQAVDLLRAALNDFRQLCTLPSGSSQLNVVYNSLMQSKKEALEIFEWEENSVEIEFNVMMEDYADVN